MKVDVLIIGAGLGGLSTAYHLERLGGKLFYLIAEKKDAPGGLARTMRKDGFLFDHTGHLLHLHDPYGKSLVLRLLQGNLALHERNSWIRLNSTYTRYPFQANTFGLPPSVVEDCVAGFMKTVHRPKPLSSGLSFKEWCLRAFGEGISKHFMFPYNEKLWRTPLSGLTTEWQGRFVPKPSVEEVLYGALTDQKKFFGYNSAFRYPIRGGIQALTDALASRVNGLLLGCRVLRLDLREKVAVIDGLGEVRWTRLVNTMPLADLLDIAEPLPQDIRRARRLLRFVSVYNLNLGVARPKVSDKHWIYFPEPEFPFYRVGFPGNFSPYLGPKGTSSMYIEVSRRPEEPVDLVSLERQILRSLRSCGILKPSDRLLARLWAPIRCAYVIYDFNRTPAVRTILPFLKKAGIESIGRYGAWKYSFMEETLLEGKACAERLLGKKKKPVSDKDPQAELKALQ